MKLLISDANIIIDIAAGGLVQAMFALDYEFAVPDILYADELEAQHANILNAGLKRYELPPELVNSAIALYENTIVTQVSVNDCLALALAQAEECPLLTGDAKLKQLAISMGVTVYGTLWLVEQMLIGKHISVQNAKIAYQKMIEDGSRLPEIEIKKQLKKYGV
jgi:predicted nucleic acid-binding protein